MSQGDACTLHSTCYVSSVEVNGNIFNYLLDQYYNIIAELIISGEKHTLVGGVNIREKVD